MVADCVAGYHATHIDGIRIVPVGENATFWDLQWQQCLKPRGLRARGGPGSVAVAFETVDENHTFRGCQLSVRAPSILACSWPPKTSLGGTWGMGVLNLLCGGFCWFCRLIKRFDPVIRWRGVVRYDCPLGRCPGSSSQKCHSVFSRAQTLFFKSALSLVS